MPQQKPTAYDFWYKVFWNISILQKHNIRTLDDKHLIKFTIVTVQIWTTHQSIQGLQLRTDRPAYTQTLVSFQIKTEKELKVVYQNEEYSL
jgi:hypothetical protein